MTSGSQAQSMPSGLQDSACPEGWALLWLAHCWEDFGMGLRITRPLQPTPLTWAMHNLHGVTSSPALGVGTFWRASDSLLCWL